MLIEAQKILVHRLITRILCSFVRDREKLVLCNNTGVLQVKLKKYPLPLFRGMGDPQEKGDYHHAADRDEGEAAGRPRGWRSRRRFRTSCHHEHDRRRRATGAYNSGGSVVE